VADVLFPTRVVGYVTWAVSGLKPSQLEVESTFCRFIYTAQQYRPNLLANGLTRGSDYGQTFTPTIFL